MKFIFQNLKFLDNQYALEFAKAYWDFRNEGKAAEIRTEIEIFHEGDANLPDLKELCPVGSVEWTCDWYERVWGKKPKPRNIPPELYSYFPGRICKAPAGSNKFLIPDNILHSHQPATVEINFEDWMIKSSETIKSNMNGRYNGIDEVGAILDLYLDEEQILTSWIKNILSEWRCFVYQGRFLDAKCYSWTNSPFEGIPDNVEDMIHSFESSGNAPIAYTLDVGVVKTLDGKSTITIPIEVHDFFSCGLYGFEDVQRFPFMLYRWFKEYANNN